MSLILVTGACGFIGRHLAQRLASQGHVVIGLGHGLWPATEALRWGVTYWHNGEIHVSNLRILQGLGTPDVVYHLAGGSSVGASFANPREDFVRTVVSTVELLEWLRLDAPTTRLVAVSSAAVYGSGYQGPIPEDAILQPYSPYGHHKQIMETLCLSYARSYGINVSVARLFSVFGPELKKQLLWDLCTRLQSGDFPLILGGSGNELRDWVDVREAACALELLLSQPMSVFKVVNVGRGLGVTVRDIALELIRVWKGDDSASDSLEFSGCSRPGDPFSLIADPYLLNSLGFQWRIDLEHGLANYVEWFRTYSGSNL